MPKPKFYELTDKITGAVCFRGSTTQILEGAGITQNTWENARAVGALWERYAIRELTEQPEPLPFIEPEIPKKKNEKQSARDRKKHIRRTSSSVWYV